jgi:myo-inositol-1-phosphate synthase
MIPNKAPVIIDLMVNSAILVSAGTKGLNLSGISKWFMLSINVTIK